MIKSKKNSKIIGITGGFGSGKTVAANIIEKSGYPVIYTDILAKDIIISDEKVKKRLIAEFGNDIYGSDGNLNTSLLSGLVFGESEESKKKLEKLNSIVHPEVIDLMIKLTDEYEGKGEELIFIESALIYEAGLEDGFDYVIVISSEEDIIKKRLIEKRGYSEEEIKSRMKAQIPLKIKKGKADFVIENNGTLDELERSVKLILNIMESS